MIKVMRLPLADAGHHKSIAPETAKVIAKSLKGRKIKIKGGALGQAEIIAAEVEGDHIKVSFEIDDSLAPLMADELRGELIIKESDANVPKD